MKSDARNIVQNLKTIFGCVERIDGDVNADRLANALRRLDFVRDVKVHAADVPERIFDVSFETADATSARTQIREITAQYSNESLILGSRSVHGVGSDTAAAAISSLKYVPVSEEITGMQNADAFCSAIEGAVLWASHPLPELSGLSIDESGRKFNVSFEIKDHPSCRAKVKEFASLIMNKTALGGSQGRVDGHSLNFMTVKKAESIKDRSLKQISGLNKEISKMAKLEKSLAKDIATLESDINKLKDANSEKGTTVDRLSKIKEKEAELGQKKTQLEIVKEDGAALLAQKAKAANSYNAAERIQRSKSAAPKTKDEAKSPKNPSSGKKSQKSGPSTALKVAKTTAKVVKTTADVAVVGAAVAGTGMLASAIITNPLILIPMHFAAVLFGPGKGSSGKNSSRSSEKSFSGGKSSGGKSESKRESSSESGSRQSSYEQPARPEMASVSRRSSYAPSERSVHTPSSEARSPNASSGASKSGSAPITPVSATGTSSSGSAGGAGGAAGSRASGSSGASTGASSGNSVSGPGISSGKIGNQSSGASSTGSSAGSSVANSSGSSRGATASAGSGKSGDTAGSSPSSGRGSSSPSSAASGGSSASASSGRSSSSHSASAPASSPVSGTSASGSGRSTTSPSGSASSSGSTHSSGSSSGASSGSGSSSSPRTSSGASSQGAGARKLPVGASAGFGAAGSGARPSRAPSSGSRKAALAATAAAAAAKMGKTTVVPSELNGIGRVLKESTFSGSAGGPGSGLSGGSNGLVKGEARNPLAPLSKEDKELLKKLDEETPEEALDSDSYEGIEPTDEVMDEEMTEAPEEAGIDGVMDDASSPEEEVVAPENEDDEELFLQTDLVIRSAKGSEAVLFIRPDREIDQDDRKFINSISFVWMDLSGEEPVPMSDEDMAGFDVGPEERCAKFVAGQGKMTFSAPIDRVLGNIDLADGLEDGTIMLEGIGPRALCLLRNSDFSFGSPVDKE